MIEDGVADLVGLDLGIPEREEDHAAEEKKAEGNRAEDEGEVLEQMRQEPGDEGTTRCGGKERGDHVVHPTITTENACPQDQAEPNGLDGVS